MFLYKVNMQQILGIFLLGIICLSVSWAISAKDSAVILMYHHVSETTPKSTSVSPKIFYQHLQYLAEHHKVLPLKTVIDALQNGQDLPPKTVVITFDDGYANIYHHAHPMLKAFNFPYTVFINPPLISKASYQLTWQQISQMADENASFANHGLKHEHMLSIESGGSHKQWLTDTMLGIEQAEQMLLAKLGYSHRFFAYPYGEFDSALKDHIAEQGFVGFGQHSGAVAAYSDFGALPRFPAAGVYSHMDSLKVKLNSLAMPLSDIQPADPKAQISAPLSTLSFTVLGDDIVTEQVSCFQNSQLLEQNVKNRRISVDVLPLKKAGRYRINCTALSQAQPDRFYWFSHPIFIPTLGGEWLN
jgi:peptidoglycan/xylan/chitin deacetylase (PgdA/CDA1 family)